MPTYDFRCAKCSREFQVVRSIGDHIRSPRPFFCCGGVEADRWFPPSGLNAEDNVLAGDRGYEGLVATDGTLINSRSKHREYMHRHGLTTADDFKDTWAKAEKARSAYRRGEPGSGAVTRDDIARAFARSQGG